MDMEILAGCIGISTEDVEVLLNQSSTEIYQNTFYQNLIAGLDYKLLGKTLQDARAVYDTYLPDLAIHLRDVYHLSNRGMTSLTLGNWLLGFLHNPNTLSKLYEMHRHIPMDVLEEGLPAVLDILGQMPPTGRTEWQKAMALLSLPFFAQE
ncbi:MAG: hypothetical protein KJ064_11235 [Anaerolineae bacterium]|nr:MAG: hypothetical protein F9K27_00415 [Anaerolineae bacterium]MCL4877226.1 hypothetical protein [Anaerolineae bacterium]